MSVSMHGQEKSKLRAPTPGLCGRTRSSAFIKRKRNANKRSKKPLLSSPVIRNAKSHLRTRCATDYSEPGESCKRIQGMERPTPWVWNQETPWRWNQRHKLYWSKNPGVIPQVLLHLVGATADAFSWCVMEMLHYFMQIYYSILLKVSPYLLDYSFYYLLIHFIW